MKKISLLISLVFLLFIIFSAYSFAQLEMDKKCKQGMMMGEKVISLEKFEKSGGGMMHQMGCCMMSPQMLVKMCGMMKGEEGMGSCKMGSQMCMKMCREEEMGCCKREFFLCCKKDLELTDKQVDALKSIKMDLQKRKIRMEADLQIAKLDLKSLMSDEEASLKKIESNMRNVEILKTDMKLSHLKAFRKAKKLLTEEQREKMMKCHKK